MNNNQVDLAVTKALDNFDRWNDVVGIFKESPGYYAEIQSVITDAVHIGIQMALFRKISTDKENNILYNTHY